MPVAVDWQGLLAVYYQVQQKSSGPNATSFTAPLGGTHATKLQLTSTDGNEELSRVPTSQVQARSTGRQERASGIKCRMAMHVLTYGTAMSGVM